VPEVTRRRIVAGAAWSVPVLLVGAPAAQAACSGPVTYYTPGLSVTSSTTTKDANGHTIGWVNFNVENNGSTTIPAGTTYTVTLTAEKAPGTTAKDIVVTASAAGVTPAGAFRFNPSGGTDTVISKTFSVVLPADVVPGATVVLGWYVDSETGIGATRLRLDADLVTYGFTSCGGTTTGTTTRASAYWGAR
jgi:hypothetical protein